MDPLSSDDVRRVAALSKLELTDEQIARSREQLARVLGHMDTLREVDTEGVEPMARPDDTVNRLGDDAPTDALPREALERIAPAMHDEYIRVPKVLGEGGGA